MKNQNLKLVALAVIVSIGFAACSGLKKMAKKANTISYEAQPNPLELHGDSVMVTITGNFPPKYFKKKVTLNVVPTLKYEGGEVAMKNLALQGEAAQGNAQIIKYTDGGKFTYTDKIAYSPSMKKSELELRATAMYKKKKKDFPAVKIADATITTPLLVQNNEKAMLGKDKFTKTVPAIYNADIHFVISQSDIRSSELKKDDMKGLLAFLKKGVSKNYIFNTIDVSAYASPDGEQDKNANLAQDRGDATAKYLSGELKKLKVDSLNKRQNFYNKTSVAEDWEGFKALMEASKIDDKDMILRILSTYSNLDEREQEIKNISKTYTEIAEDILPQLRKSKIQVNAEELSRTDEQITALAASAPDSLSNEELLYAATLTNDLNTKLSIYQSASRVYANDWRGPNNTGYVYLMQNKLNEAEGEFDKARKLSEKQDEVFNNLGVVARWKGNRRQAEEYYKMVAAPGEETKNNLAILYIMKGDYANAVANFGSMCSFNASLAKVLAGDNEGALKTLECSEDKNTAMGYYLKAIIGARTKNNDLMITNIKSAIAKDATLKTTIAEDLEFLKYRNNDDFKAAIN
jgi:hypothetical protein